MGICARRGFHRYVAADPHGPDVEVYDDCLECGIPRAVEKRFAPHIEVRDDADHTVSTVCVGDTRAHAAKNETELLASMVRAAVA